MLTIPNADELVILQICSDDLQRLSTGDEGLATELQHPEDNDDVYVRPVKQKGLGLSSVKESLESFDTPESSSANRGREEEYEDKKARQQQLEANVARSAVARWRTEFEQMQRNPGLYGPGGLDRMSLVLNEWTMKLVSAIVEELRLVAEAEKTKANTRVCAERREYGVYLRSLKPERLAAVTIISVLGVFSKAGMSNAVKTTPLVMEIARDIQDELIADALIERSRAMLNNNRRRLNKLKTILSDRKSKDGHFKWKWLVDKLNTTEPIAAWPLAVSTRVGAVLLSLLFDAAKVAVEVQDPNAKQAMVKLQPGLSHSYHVHWGRRIGIIHLNPEVVRLMVKEPSPEVLGRHMPMVCEPKPWTDWTEGGYQLYRDTIVRVTPGDTLQPRYVQTALKRHGLGKIRQGLDVLGKTAWNVNKDVFDVMLEAWNSGEAIADICPVDPNIPDPPRPGPGEGVAAEKEWLKQMRLNENERTGMHSNRCFQNFQMEVARAFRNETFYLPHNMDFRGRAYPLPPYLNQMSADNGRGLLLFNKAKTLGQRGLFWLKIQIANLYGFDKASFAEREQFVMDNLDDVLDSANHGLRGKKWWLKAEEPWQCLAACMELRNALRLPDPTQYGSRLPIHQDGSCNGLQHYAALGGDLWGAQQVNLEPSDRPSDVYTGVSEYVEREIAREAALDVPMAKLLDGKITRKIVKQTVMTNVYGVTFHGAMKQVTKQLENHYPEELHGKHFACAGYIAQKIFDSLGSMFSGAHDIQYWLGDCATRISQSLPPEQIESIARTVLSSTEDPAVKSRNLLKQFKTTVIWTTPLGLPVAQPYRSRQLSRRIYTSLQDISIAQPSSLSPISKRKQLQAFPPNFIHSLDATHMMMSAVACSDAGLSFSAVHDSFWTHACDVDAMNHILRDMFVAMHSDDVIRRLAAEFKVRYGDNLFLATIRRGSPIAKEVLKVRRQNGTKGRIHELIDEYRRFTLIQSDDPELQAQGRAMKTPGSVFEEKGGTNDDLVVFNTLGDVTRNKKLDADIDSMDNPAGEGRSSNLNEHVDATANDDDSAPKKTATRASDALWIWLPMSFRDLPKKGDWDVSRIRDSRYFFS